jgi:two-component system, chemotaxis family, response regulator PixG
MPTVNERITSLTAHLQDFFLQLKKVKTDFFSGSLMVKMHSTDSYLVFNFHLGRLNWSGRSFEQFDCWRRHLGIICSRVSGVEINALAAVNQPELVSETLVNLLAKEKINRKQLNDIIAVIFEENLFDAIQFACMTGIPFQYEWLPSNDQEKNLARALPLLAIKPHLNTAFEKWQVWYNKGLGDFYANLPIRLVDLDRLNDLVLSDKQQKILPFLTHGYNLRSLAGTLRQPLQTTAETLLPLIKKQAVILAAPEPYLIELPEELDNPSEASSLFDDSMFAAIPPSGDVSQDATVMAKPLIACIDDSDIVHQSLQQILIPHGYQCLSIHDSIQALPALIRAKPDMIFLDLIMPIANGYEICTQIRRTPALRNVPVIILTGKEGMVDKIRAKMVGSTDFLTKPVDPHAVLKMLFYHLPVKQ